MIPEDRFAKTFLFALKQCLPVIFAYLVVGFTFGMMMNELGASVFQTAVASFFTYSGSLQIAMVPMISAGTPLPVILFASFLINSRYMFYGIGFSERFRKQGLLFPYMVIAFPDEVFGIFTTVRCPEYADPVLFDRCVAMICHSAWCLGGIIGNTAGRNIPFDFSGIEFAATAMFVCLFLNMMFEMKEKLPILIGFICGLLCLFVLGPSGFMLPALSLSLVILVILRKRIEGGGDISEVTSGGGRNE